MYNFTFSSVLDNIFRFLLLLIIGSVLLPFAHAQLDDVNLLMEERRYPEAVDILKKLANTTKDIETRSKLYHQLGEIYYNYTQQYPEAIKAYQKIIEMESKGLSIAEIYLSYIKIGDVYARMGKYDRAISSFRTLIDLAPETHFVYKLGYQKIRDIRNALKYLRVQREIVEKYKGTQLEAVAQFQIAEIFRSHSQLNQPKQAIVEYEKLLIKYPNDKLAPEAQWRIAHLKHTVFHQFSIAIDEYYKVAENYPTSNFAAEAIFHIANLHREQENYQESLAQYNVIKEKYPNFWNMHAVYYWSGFCYEKINSYNQAREAFNIFLNVYLPTLDPVYLGQIAMYDKSVKDVTVLLQNKINTLNEKISLSQFEKLEKDIVDGNYQNALKIAHNIISTAPNTQVGKRTTSLLRLIENKASIQNLSKHLNEDQLSPLEKVRTQLEIATIYERNLLDYPKAVEAYNRVIQVHPISSYTAEARYRIGIIYAELLEKPNSALQTFNAVIKYHPNTLQAMMATFQVGEIYRKLKRSEEALRAYKNTISYPERELYLSGGYKDSYADIAQFRIGRVHYEDQRYEDARFAFQEFIKNRPDSPRAAAAHIYLAVMHQNSGEDDIAVKYYQQAEMMLSNSPVQMQMVIDETGSLGFQDKDTIKMILQDRINRLKRE